MYKYVLKRLLMLIPVIIGVSFLVFFIMSLSPDDPARTILGETAPIEAVEALREELGLNDPVLKRYVDYMGGLLHGDMGTSYKSDRPVFDEIIGRFPATLKLSLWGMLFAVVLSIPIGIISATKQYSLVDGVSMVGALLGFPHYEEIGHGGAYLPDEVEEFVAVDIGLIGPDYEGNEFNVAICCKDAYSPYDYDLTTRIIETAERIGCDYAVDIFYRYGTDASVAIKSGRNVRVAAFGMPVYCSHAVERTHIKSLENTTKLLVGYALGL